MNQENENIFNTNDQYNNMNNSDQNNMQQPIVDNSYNTIPPKKNGTGKKWLIIGLITLIIVLAIVIFVVIKPFDKSSNGKPSDKSEQTNKTEKGNYDDILDHITIDDVKLSELNSLNDFINKLNYKIGTVYIQDAADETYAYESRDYDKFLQEDLSNIKVSDMFFYLSDSENNNIVRFFVDYDDYVKDKNNVTYRLLEYEFGDRIAKLDGEYLKDIKPRTYREKYKLEKGTGLYIEFNNNGKLYAVGTDMLGSEINIRPIKEIKQKAYEVKTDLLSLDDIKELESKYENNENVFDIYEIIDYSDSIGIAGNLRNGSFKEGDEVKYIDWYGNLKTAKIISFSKWTHNYEFDPRYMMVLDIEDYDIEDSSIIFIE